MREHEHQYAEKHGVTVERAEVTIVRFLRGNGCCDESPIRQVTAYFDADGVLIAERDPSAMGADARVPA